MMGVEGRGARRELPVQGVHNGRIEPRRHRERGEAAVVVDNVEASIRGGSIDLVERSCDVIDLVQRTLDLIWMALAEKRRHSADEGLREHTDDRLHATVAGRRNRDPRRRQHGHAERQYGWLEWQSRDRPR